MRGRARKDNLLGKNVVKKEHKIRAFAAGGNEEGTNAWSYEPEPSESKLKYLGGSERNNISEEGEHTRKKRRGRYSYQTR